MAPLPPNSTNRLFFDYISGNLATSIRHTVAVRYDPADRDVGDVQEDFLNVLQALGASALREGWRVLGTRVQAAGAEVTLPVTTIVSLAGFVGSATGPYSRSVEAVEATFQGRSPTSGRRVDFSLYTAAFGVGDAFRYPVASSGFGATIAAALAELETASAAGSFLAIDGSAPSWYDYLNVQYNSYWESRIRRG